MVALGWTLGFLECICIAILIGIGADFVTHLSAAYSNNSDCVDRRQRTEHALVHMGPSVLAAAFTTISGALIMIFTQILFFKRFAFVLLFTIVHSTVGALIVFCTLTNCCGPENMSTLLSNLHCVIDRIRGHSTETLSTTSSESNKDDESIDESIPEC
jgi:predicted RND superfamily exporter protein